MATHRDLEKNERPGAMIARTHTTRGGALKKNGVVLGVEPLMTPRRVAATPSAPAPRRGWRRLLGSRARWPRRSLRVMPRSPAAASVCGDEPHAGHGLVLRDRIGVLPHRAVPGLRGSGRRDG